ncbi:hypothetical protein BDZ89DRAFT_397324 [Hymenopellis radicata]|nr:hypothetical protein BDZ89DRAFT_397324 [Hymenopellis radicata]
MPTSCRILFPLLYMYSRRRGRRDRHRASDAFISVTLFVVTCAFPSDHHHRTLTHFALASSHRRRRPPWHIKHSDFRLWSQTGTSSTLAVLTLL